MQSTFYMLSPVSLSQGWISENDVTVAPSL